MYVFEEYAVSLAKRIRSRDVHNELAHLGVDMPVRMRTMSD